MVKKFNLAVKTGSYQKDGETKNTYLNVGSVMENDNGSFIILDRTFNPAGVPNPDNKSSVIISMFAPKDKGESGISSMGKEDKTAENPFSDDDLPQF